MCVAVRCRQCGKTSWSGCGRHVDAVLAGVPEGQRCQCQPAARASRFAGLFRRSR